MGLEKPCKIAVSESKEAVGKLLRETRSNADQQKLLKSLMDRLTEANSSLVKERKPIEVHEERFKAKEIQADAAAKVATLEEEVKKATSACAPLLEKAGEEYLISISTDILATALKDHARSKNLDEDALFKEACSGKSMGEEAFITYVQGLPASIGHEEVNFTKERASAI